MENATLRAKPSGRSKPWPRRCQQSIELIAALGALTPLVALLLMGLSAWGTKQTFAFVGITSALTQSGHWSGDRHPLAQASRGTRKTAFSARPRVLATVFGSVRRLVDLIEDAAIGEVGGLRLSPTAE